MATPLLKSFSLQYYWFKMETDIACSPQRMETHSEGRAGKTSSQQWLGQISVKMQHKNNCIICSAGLYSFQVFVVKSEQQRGECSQAKRLSLLHFTCSWLCGTKSLLLPLWYYSCTPVPHFACSVTQSQSPTLQGHSQRPEWTGYITLAFDWPVGISPLFCTNGGKWLA